MTKLRPSIGARLALVGIRVVKWSSLYLCCWLVGYVFVNGGLDRHVVEYFVLAWTGDAFVRPFFTQVFSLLLLGLVAAAHFAVRRRQSQHERRLREVRGEE